MTKHPIDFMVFPFLEIIIRRGESPQSLVLYHSQHRPFCSTMSHRNHYLYRRQQALMNAASHGSSIPVDGINTPLPPYTLHENDSVRRYENMASTSAATNSQYLRLFPQANPDESIALVNNDRPRARSLVAAARSPAPEYTDYPPDRRWSAPTIAEISSGLVSTSRRPGPFKFLEKARAGETSTTYAVHDCGTKKTLCLKTYKRQRVDKSASAQESLRRELAAYKLLAEDSSPFVIQLHGVFQDDLRIYLATVRLHAFIKSVYILTA
jgi:hypothetical protein